MKPSAEEANQQHPPAVPDPHLHLLLPENPPPSYSEAVELAKAENQNQQNDGKERSRTDQVPNNRRSLFKSRNLSSLSVQNILLVLLLVAIIILILLFAFYIIFLRGDPIDKQLLLASESDDGALVSQLLDKGANVNVRLQEFQGRTALHLAAHHGHVDIVKMLLTRGANATAMSSNVQWQKPLHAAANADCKQEIVTMLLERGATPEDRDANGREAIDYPTSRHCIDTLWAHSVRRRNQLESEKRMKEWQESMKALMDKFDLRMEERRTENHKK